MSDKGRLHELTVAIRVALSGYKKDMSAVKAETAKVRDAVAGETQKINGALGSVTTAKAQKEIDRLTEQIGRQKEKISAQEAAVAKLKRGYEDLVSGFSQDRSKSGIEKQLKSTEKEFEQVKKKLFALYDEYEIAEGTANAGGGTSKMSALSKEIDELEPRYEQLGRLVQKLNLKLDQVRMNPEASTSAQDMAARIEIETQKLERMKREAETTEEKLDAVTGETQKINGALESVTTAKAQQEIDQLTEQIGRLKRGYEDLVSGLSQDRSKSGIEKQLKSTEKEFEQVQKKLFALYDAYKIAEGTANAGGGTSKMSALSKEIDELEPRYEKLERLIQALNVKLDQVCMNPEASTSAQNMAAQIEIETQKLERMKREAATTKEKLDAVMSSKSPPTTGKKISGIIAKIKELAKSAKSTSAQSSGDIGRVEKAVGQLGKRIHSLVSGVLVFDLIRRGLTGMRTQISAVLKTNREFTASLTTVKTNLQVSFAAIYQAVLPALNALMRAVAALTTAFAVMVSSLFGSSYAASLKAAQGIRSATKAVNGYSAAADAAQSFSFDETHNISKTDASGGGNDGSGMMQMPEISGGETEGLIAKIKAELAGLFEPVKTSWDLHGDSVMNSARTALDRIKSLCGSVGKSFADVWKNGTGVSVCSQILSILGYIFDTVGNIAAALSSAWNFDDTGTQILQGLFDILTIILDAIASCAEATAEWSAGLDFTPILTAFNGLLQAVQPITSTVCDALAWMYQNILLPFAAWTIQDVMPAFFNLLSAALGAVNAVLNAFKPLGEWLWNLFLQPIAAWTGGVICDVLSVLADILDGIGSWIAAHQEEISGIGLIIAEVATAVGLVTAALAIYNTVTGIATGATTVFSAAVSFITSPIGIAIAIVTALIAVGVQLYQNWDTVKAKASAIWTAIKTTVTSVVSAIKTGISTMLTTVSTIWDNTWTACKTTVTSIFDGIWSAIKNVINSILGGIESMCNAVISGINVMINALNKISFDIPGWVPGLGGKSFGFNLSTIEPVSLPRLAQGGIVDRATALIAGEAGREAIVPLENNTGWLDMISSRIAEYIDRRLSGVQGDGGADSRTLEITIPITLELDGEPLLKKLIRVRKRMGPGLTAESI